MANEKYFSFAKPNNDFSDPDNGIVRIVEMNKNAYKGCIYGNAYWIVGNHKRDEMFKHNSDELLMLIGNDPDNIESLGAEVELWIENDKLVLKNNCIVFIPAGAAHGPINVKSVKTPFFNYLCHMNTDTYEEIPAKAAAPKGTYANNRVERYEPVDGYLPPAPEGFLTRLLWIDGKKLKGAPYLESVWFHTMNDTGPESHGHEFDEVIGFFGSDPEHPDDLGAYITFEIGGEVIDVKKSCMVHVPRGVDHSPLLVPKLNRRLIHFSGGNGGEYARK